MVGRRREGRAFKELLDSVSNGRSEVLVVRGEPGIGKTTLLDQAVEQASGFQVARATGVESEMELPYAGLHQLCRPMLDRLTLLPAPQREAAGIAFGIAGGRSPDRFLVGLAILGLLSEASEQAPVLCVVDDAQWLDRASTQVLAFVARRLLAERVGLLFATRDRNGDLQRLPELLVEGLADADARALLASVLRLPLDEGVRERIIAEAHGNPLALVEWPDFVSPAELAGGFGLPALRAVSGRLEDGFRRRLADLPVPTQRFLTVAAAEPTGDPALVWRAAARLRASAEDASPAVEAGLVELWPKVSFRHPLVRSVAYRVASIDDRREVHRALAEATDADTDPDHRAWHRALAAPGPDEEVAAELERSAVRARARGGVAAGAAFLERAVELTPDPRRRAQRALLAAQDKYPAGALDAALRLLAMAQTGPLDELERARAQLLHARITATMTRGRDAALLHLHAAKRLEPLDSTLARETYLEALGAALRADRLVGSGEAAEVASAVLAADWEPSTRACDLLLDGLAVFTREGYVAGAPALKVALRAFRDERHFDEDDLRWLWMACHVARALGDFDAWDELNARHLDLARRAGAFSILPVALLDRMVIELLAGRIGTATSLAAESDAVVEATASHLFARASIVLANWRGRDAGELALIEAQRQAGLREGLWLTPHEWGNALRYNGLGRYEDALPAAERATEAATGLGPSILLLAELIEAAVRSGQAQRAAGPLAQLAEIAHAADTDWALGTQARAAAMLAEGSTAEQLYREAIERLSRTRGSETLARAHLLYGEWLRRENRRVDAREQLRIAHTMLTDMGMEAFAERASRELLATGETVRKRTVETLDELTPQELQVARLAIGGQTNPEIGAQLFISARTVEWHLRKVFTKLNISSRKELRETMLRPAPAGRP